MESVEAISKNKSIEKDSTFGEIEKLSGTVTVILK
jgi:hypothetical protein